MKAFETYVIDIVALFGVKEKLIYSCKISSKCTFIKFSCVDNAAYIRWNKFLKKSKTWRSNLYRITSMLCQSV